MAHLPMASTSASERVLDRLTASGATVRSIAGGWMATCPAHPDRNPSLHVAEGDRGVVLKCQAGCDTRDVIAKLDLTESDLFNEPLPAPQRTDPTLRALSSVANTKPVAEYLYTDADAQPVLKVTRYATLDGLGVVTGKTFKQSRFVNDRWVGRLGDLEPPLYHLPAVLAAVRDGRPVFVVEGEKDADRLTAIGHVATCNPMGAGKWRPWHTAALAGAMVFVVADDDPPGLTHALTVVRELEAVAWSVVPMVPAPGYNDVTAHLDAGNDVSGLRPLTTAQLAVLVEGAPPAVEVGRSLVATPAAEIAMRAPRWLYELRMPAGAITLLAGREGLGKSTISYDLAARITKGLLPGQFHGRPRAVAVVASEDDWSAVVVPRLVAARADLKQVFRVEAKTEEGRFETVSVPADLDRLAALCATRDAALVVVDPIMSVIDARLDTHKDRDVRQALEPLTRFATTADVAVLALIHINKSVGTDPLNSIMASRAFSAVARSVLYCMVDPESDDEDRYLFGHPKSNLGPRQATLGYHLIEVKIELDEPAVRSDPVIRTSRVVWDGVDTRSIRDAMETRATREPVLGEVSTAIVTWVREQGHTVSTTAIAAQFPNVKRTTLDVNLSRLVTRGLLYRPVRGEYSVPIANTSYTTYTETDMSDSNTEFLTTSLETS